MKSQLVIKRTAIDTLIPLHHDTRVTFADLFSALMTFIIRNVEHQDF